MTATRIRRVKGIASFFHHILGGVFTDFISGGKIVVGDMSAGHMLSENMPVVTIIHLSPGCVG
jgi:hypothetical protein